MKAIKEFINESGAENVRWFPEDYNITKSEDAIDMILGLIEASSIPDMLADAYEEGNFDLHDMFDAKIAMKLAKGVGDLVNDKYNEIYG